MPGPSRARLAIPRVQQNPKPPVLRNGGLTAPKSAAPKGPVAPHKPGPTVISQGLQNRRASQPSAAFKQAANNISNTNFSGVTPVGSTPGSTSAAAAAPAAGPEELFKIPSWTPSSPGEADPRDSSYWANVAKLKFTDEQAYQKTLGEESASNSGYNLALQQAIRGRGVQERELGENAIKGNLGASGWLGRNQAEQSTTYAEERGAAARGHEGEQQAFVAARKALQQGFGIEAAQELAEAAGRRAELAGEETESGAPEVAPVAAALRNQVKPKPGKVVKYGQKGSGPGYTKGKFTGKFFG